MLTTDAEPELDRMRVGYSVRDPDRVSEFLKAHPFLLPLLGDARPKIAECFGLHTDVWLEVVSDPEAPDTAEFFGYIRTALPPDEASRRLRRFDREWFIRALRQARGALNFDVEFA